MLIVTNKVSSLKVRITHISVFSLSQGKVTQLVRKHPFTFLPITELNSCPAHPVSFSLAWIPQISVTDKRGLKFKAPHKTLLPPSLRSTTDSVSCFVREGRDTPVCDNTRPHHNMDAKLWFPVATD